MINYNPKSWITLIFQVKKYGTFRKLLPSIIVLAILTGIYCYIQLELLEESKFSTAAIQSFVGFVISLMLVFRTDTAYDNGGKVGSSGEHSPII